MRKILNLVLLFIIFGFSFGQKPARNITNESFTKGERLEYRVHYGLINAGVATMEVSDKLYKVNNRPCYKIDIHGKTVGFFDLAYKVNNNWGAYIDTASLVPHKSYRFIAEGRYRKNEVVDFNQIKEFVSVATMDREAKQIKETKEFKVPESVQDIVGGAYFLRTIDFSNTKEGETLKIDAFFENETFDFNVKYIGKEKVKTKIGEFNTLVLAPILPANKLFVGEDPIKLYISNDKNKIPLKIKANLFVGALEIDIKSYENLRTKIN